MSRKRAGQSRIGGFFLALRYRIGEFALRAFVGALPCIPIRLLVLFTDFSAWASFYCLWKYRARMEENLAMALGAENNGAAERKALIWRAWKNFGRGMLDTTTVLQLSPEKIIAAVALEGEEHLKRALAEGRGVIALSAHLGSFTLIGARLAAGGYPFSVVVKHPRDKRFARLIDDYRARLGIQTISARPRREAARGILKALRANRIVLVIADEFKSGDVMVNFMGQTAPAPRGPATLALRARAATLPMFATRRADTSVVLAIGPAIEPIERDDLDQSVIATTQLYTRHLEAAIRKYPDQWNWLGFPRKRKISRAELALRIKSQRSAKARTAPSAPQEKETGPGDHVSGIDGRIS